jgi:hypothetical protein
LAAIEVTTNAWQRFVANFAREPKDADGKAAILTPAYARWQADQDVICHDIAYTLMLATAPITAAGAVALVHFCNTNALSGPSSKTLLHCCKACSPTWRAAKRQIRSA